MILDDLDQLLTSFPLFSLQTTLDGTMTTTTANKSPKKVRTQYAVVIFPSFF
jgi:hypothetical protein